jgi:hypothetical protein
MAYFLIRHEGAVYINDELYYTAIAGGERAFMKMLAHKEVSGKSLFDQVLYPVTPEQLRLCEDYNPVTQDFDTAFKYFNVLSEGTIAQIRAHWSDAFPTARLITIHSIMVPQCFLYRHVTFFRMRDYKYSGKYRVLSKMAAVKVFGSYYAALNAVDVRVEKPIIATLKD